MEVSGKPLPKPDQRLNRAMVLRLPAYSSALAYILAVHFAYVGYIHPTFAYALYHYLPFSPVGLSSTYFITWLPILAYRRSDRPAQAATALIYALLYVPIQLSLLFQVERSYDKLLWIQAMLALSMIVLFIVAKGKMRQRKLVTPVFWTMDLIVLMVSLVAVLWLLAVNHEHMRLVSFADVYDLRSESATAVGRSRLHDYLTSWLIYCFISYLFARGLVHRKLMFVLLGFVFATLQYMAAGHKTTILLLPLTLGLYWLWGGGQNFLLRLLLGAAVLIFIVTATFPDEGVGGWMKSILLIRLVGSSGWLVSKYLEFFQGEGLTYFSHVAPINALTGMYPYGDLSLGQMISLATSGTIEANHNASFWASDGIAALGPIGILAITPVVAIVLYAVNRIMTALDSKFAVLWMGGFFMALLNVPLSTALLSGGGLIIFAQAFWLSKVVHRSVTGTKNVTKREHLDDGERMLTSTECGGLAPSKTAPSGPI